MPNALIALPDVYESVVRRVAVDVTAQLARTMRLPGTTQVYLPGNTDTVPMNGGAFGDVYDPGVRYPAEANLVVRYNEEVDEAHTLTTPINNQEHHPLFQDLVRDITIRPVYRYVTFTVTMEYTAPSLVLAQRWVDDMRSRISMLRAELYQTLEYHYAVPPAVLHLLQHLHDTMERSAAPTGKSFSEYFTDHFMVPTKTATTMIGTSPTIVVPEKQYEVLGWFDFTTSPPTPEKKDNTGTYSSTISYSLHYNRPTQMYCTWPMLIHNRVIGREFRPQEPYETFRKVTRRVSTTKGSFDSLLRMMEAKGVPYVQYPDTDDWVPEYIPDKRLTFFTALLQIKPTQPRGAIDLSNLGDYTFTPYFLEYFFQQGNRLFGRSSSIFEFRLYENREYRNGINFQFIPGTVSIETDQDLDMTKYYHIQISLKRNWYVIDSDTLQCLRRYPSVLYASLRALGVTFGETSFNEVRTLGAGTALPYSEECPGEGSLIGHPDQGGVWPWPWLDKGWEEIGYPGDMWEGPGWPGGGWDVPTGGVVPTWPGDHNWPGHGDAVWPRGIVTNKDLQDAVKQTDQRAGHYIDRVRIGPLNVLYADIIALRRSTK